MKTKTCLKCKETKSAKEFSPDKRRRDGLYSRCKACRREDGRDFREVNREKERKRCRAWAKDNKKHCLDATAAWRKRNPFASRLQMSRAAAKRRGHEPCTATVDELKAAWTGKCDVCGVPHLELTKGLQMDHDHETGEFRGFLCGRCNKALGLFNDSEEILIGALHFLMNHQKIK